LVKAQVADLEAANHALAARKKRSKRRIHKDTAITIAAGRELINQTQASSQNQHEIQQVRCQDGSAAVRQYCCSGCGELGHRINKCQKR
jgi:hypothetical protein